MKLSTAYFLSSLLLSFGSAEAQVESPVDCVCLVWGCDQRGCGAGAICTFGGCVQDGLVNPVCAQGHCSQRETKNPSCGGGYCDQTRAENPVCTSYCCQDQAVGGGCLLGCTVGDWCPASDSNWEEYVPDVAQGYVDQAQEYADKDWSDWEANANGYIEQYVPDSNFGFMPDSNFGFMEADSNFGFMEADSNMADSNMADSNMADSNMADSNFGFMDSNWEENVPEEWRAQVSDYAGKSWEDWQDEYSDYEWDGNFEKATRFSSPNYEILSNPDNWEIFKEENFGIDTCLCVVGGCDQTSCGRFAECTGGRCNQANLIAPSCTGGGCGQIGASNPTCVGGQCYQDVITDVSCIAGNCVLSSDSDSNWEEWTEMAMDQVNRGLNCDCWSGRCDQRDCPAWATCLSGGCNQRGLESPTCLGGHCCQDGATMASCLGGNCNCDGFDDSNVETASAGPPEDAAEEPAEEPAEVAPEAEVDGEVEAEVDAAESSAAVVGTGVAGLLVGAAALL